MSYTQWPYTAAYTNFTVKTLYNSLILYKIIIIILMYDNSVIIVYLLNKNKN